jgi:hypothetical protein
MSSWSCKRIFSGLYSYFYMLLFAVSARDASRSVNSIFVFFANGIATCASCWQREGTNSRGAFWTYVRQRRWPSSLHRAWLTARCEQAWQGGTHWTDGDGPVRIDPPSRSTPAAPESRSPQIDSEWSRACVSIRRKKRNTKLAPWKRAFNWTVYSLLSLFLPRLLTFESKFVIWCAHACIHFACIHFLHAKMCTIFFWFYLVFVSIFLFMRDHEYSLGLIA